MTAHTRIGGSFKDITAISTKVGGSWKEVTDGWTRVSGAWKQFFQSGPANLYYGSALSYAPISGADLDDEGNYYGHAKSLGIFKLDPSGDMVWNRTIGESPDNLSESSLQTIAVKGTSVVFIAGDTSTTKVITYSTDGVYQGVFSVNIRGSAVALDASGAIYVSGKDSSNYATLTKFNSSGVIQWTRRTRTDNDSANKNNIVFVDDTAGWVLVGGELGVSGIDRIHFEAYDLSGTLLTRQRQSTTGYEVASIVSNGLTGLVGGLVPSGDNIIFSLNSTPALNRAIDFSTTLNNYRSIYNKMAVDPNGDYYWLFGDSGLSPRRFVVAKLDGASPTTLVWLRQINTTSNWSDPDAWNIKADANSVYITDSVAELGLDELGVVIKIASDGSTTGSVSLNTYTFTIDIPSASLVSATANTQTVGYSTLSDNATSSSATVTDTAGTLTITKDIF